MNRLFVFWGLAMDLIAVAVSVVVYWVSGDMMTVFLVVTAIALVATFVTAEGAPWVAHIAAITTFIASLALPLTLKLSAFYGESGAIAYAAIAIFVSVVAGDAAKQQKSEEPLWLRWLLALPALRLFVGAPAWVLWRRRSCGKEVFSQ